MRKFTFSRFFGVFFVCVFAGIFSCNTNNKGTQTGNTMEAEINKIDSLLRDINFTAAMAENQEAAYYKGIGKTAPIFLTTADDTSIVLRSVEDDKVATNIAGFYALECGIGLLSANTSETPIVWLERIINNNIDTATRLLLNRFANATWKAGQPFCGLDRITRPNFIVFSHLSEAEVKKDEVQIKNTAAKLLEWMKPVHNGNIEEQMKKLRSILQDTAYAVQMAAWMHAQYYTSQQQEVPPFLTAADDTTAIKKISKEIKIATNIAGFYALECGLNYIVSTRQVLPSVVLKSLADNTISNTDKMLFARFANATWKAGQPFRGLNRITRETFTPFYFLNEADIEKDLVQIKAAAEKLLKEL